MALSGDLTPNAVPPSGHDPALEPDREAPPVDDLGRRGTWLTPGVAGVGAASFFSDSGHEISTALLPSFLTSVLHGSAAALGLIEGISDALMGVMKLVGGPSANDPDRRRRMAVGGYLGTALATGAIGLATVVWQAGLLRALAWMNRGVRSPARDALLSSLAPPKSYGRAFGLERAGDNLGAVGGPLLAAGLVGWVGIRPAMWCAAIPGGLAAIAIVVAAREARRVPAGERGAVRFDLAGLRAAGLSRPFVPVILFEFGNTATTLLILRATELLHGGGRSLVAATSLAIVIYAAHNAFAAGVAFAGGHWIDRAGPRVVFGTGAALYVLAYGGFAAGPHSWLLLLVAFVLAGSGIGLSETSESALVARAVPDQLRGSGFGALGGIQAAGDVVSSVTVGILYTAVSPAVAFAYAAAWMLLSVIASSWLVVVDQPSATLSSH
jgi:MFS family permease